MGKIRQKISEILHLQECTSIFYESTIKVAPVEMDNMLIRLFHSISDASGYIGARIGLQVENPDKAMIIGEWKHTHNRVEFSLSEEGEEFNKLRSQMLEEDGMRVYTTRFQNGPMPDSPFLEFTILDLKPDETVDFYYFWTNKMHEVLNKLEGHVGHRIGHTLDDENKYIIAISWKTSEASDAYHKSDEYKYFLYRINNMKISEPVTVFYRMSPLWRVGEPLPMSIHSSLQSK